MARERSVGSPSSQAMALYMSRTFPVVSETYPTRCSAGCRAAATCRHTVVLSAAVSLRVADYYTQGPRSFFRLHEKGGRYNVVPAHHVAQEYVDAYLEAAQIGEDRRGPLFRSAEPGRRDALQARGMSRVGPSR